MANNKLSSFGPTLMVVSTGTNYVNPAAAGAGAVGYTATASYVVLRHIRIVNITATGSSFSLFIGATSGSASGTSFMGSATVVAANSFVDWYGSVRLASTDFLSGFAANANTLVITSEGEIGLA